MKYLCQVWLDGARIDALAASEKEALDRDSLAYDRSLEKNGHFIAAEALQSPSTAVTVRVRDGKASSTDGPFIETKEHLGGFILIEARDMDEAVRLAGGIPLARMELASIEVRPIYEFG